MAFIAVFGLATYALLSIAYFFGARSLYRWAWIAGTITVLLGCAPLLVFAFVLVIGKIRGDRHD